MSKQTDISQQILKYLNGELDGRAMHLLERRAQDDAFIMDAMEGYAIAGADQQANLMQLRQRLQQKITVPAARIVRLRNWSIAASVIAAMLAIAGIWMAKDRPEKQEKKLALQQKNEVIRPQGAPLNTDTVTEIGIDGGNAVAQQSRQNITGATSRVSPIEQTPPAATEREVVANTASKPRPDSVSLEEVIVLNYDKMAKEERSAKNAQAANALRKDSTEVLSGRSALSAQQDNAEKAKAVSRDTKASNMVSGIVTDGTGPLPGARVQVKGTQVSSITDITGRFKLPIEPPDRLVLDVNILGYLNKQVKVNPKDSVVITMKPKQAVSGGVITGYGAEQCCWDVYEKYLKDNAISPDGKTGTVKLSFMVNPDNSLSDFSIIKGLSEEADKKAIEIVKNGPPWVHDASGKAKKVTLKIKFAKQ